MATKNEYDTDAVLLGNIKSAGDATNEFRNSKSNLVAVDYINEIRNGISSAKVNTFTTSIPNELICSFKAIIDDEDVFKSASCHYKKVLNDLNFQFSNGRGEFPKTNEMEPGVGQRETELIQKDGFVPSDFEDQLQFSPTEAMGDKVTQIFAYLCVRQLEPAILELTNLQSMRENPLLSLLHSQLDEGFRFIGKTFEYFINWATGKNLKIFSQEATEKEDKEIPNFKTLSPQAKLVLKVIQNHILRNFHCKLNKRITLLKGVVAEDSSSAEWWINLAESCRRKRLDVPKHVRGARPADEEYGFVNKGLELEKGNPFVRMQLLDCIIDCLRDSKVSFVCGGITYSNTRETVSFMKASCREILKEFPRSVKLHSQVSDYFARFVTLNFFDIPYSEKCLQIAYKLNPNFPRTTHRLGIFNRMSKGALSASFEWFKKTEKLDSYHYTAFMECVKNMIGRPDDYNVGAIIEEKLWTEGACSWSDIHIVDLLFYKGIAHFIRKEIEEALVAWKIVSIYNQQPFRLCGVDEACGFYMWNDDLISTDKLRVWMYEEKAREDQTPERKKLVTLLYDLMIGSVEPEKSRVVYSPLTCATVFKYFKQKASL